MANLIASTFCRCTVLISTAFGKGTGFIVGQADEKRAFIVTNKHVIAKNHSERMRTKSIDLSINVFKNDSPIGAQVTFPFLQWKEHPNPHIDVLAIDATQLFDVPNIANKYIHESFFANASIIKTVDITAGDEILVLGYPMGIQQGKTNFPLVRQGIISSRIGEHLHDHAVDSNGLVVSRDIPAFLIDGAIIPGSSGSPVFLKPVSGRYTNGDLNITPTLPYLLGIVAETKIATVGPKNTEVLAGLGMAFDVATISEVLSMFPNIVHGVNPVK